MKINLRQARRLEKTLSTEQQKLQGELGEHQIRVTMHEDFATTVSDVQLKQGMTLAKIAGLLAVRFHIRKMIETKNETSGINRLMNEEAQLRESIKILELTIGHPIAANDLTIAEARHAAMKANGPAPSNYGQSIDYINVDGRVLEDAVNSIAKDMKNAQRRVAKIAEELGYMNSDVTFELPHDMVKVLEANDIVM